MKFGGDGYERHGGCKRLSQHRERSPERERASVEHCSAREYQSDYRHASDKKRHGTGDKHTASRYEEHGDADSRDHYRGDSRRCPQRGNCPSDRGRTIHDAKGRQDDLSSSMKYSSSQVKREVGRRSRSPPHERALYGVKSEKPHLKTTEGFASTNRNWSVKPEAVRGERVKHAQSPKDEDFKTKCDARISRTKRDSVGPEEKNYEWGSGSSKGNTKDGRPQLKLKPTFEPSGLLAQEDPSQKELVLEKNGVPLKHFPPEDERVPDKKWRLYMFKKQHRSSVPTGDEEPTKVMYIHRKSSFLVGKDPLVADITLYHPTISKQHAAIQFRKRFEEICPYIIDLESTNGTYLNGSKVETARYIELREGDTLRFGKSSREFVLLHSGSVDVHMSYEEFLEQRDKEKREKDGTSSVVAAA